VTKERDAHVADGSALKLLVQISQELSPNRVTVDSRRLHFRGKCDRSLEQEVHIRYWILLKVHTAIDELRPLVSGGHPFFHELSTGEFYSDLMATMQVVRQFGDSGVEEFIVSVVDQRLDPEPAFDD